MLLGKCFAALRSQVRTSHHASLRERPRIGLNLGDMSSESGGTFRATTAKRTPGGSAGCALALHHIIHREGDGVSLPRWNDIPASVPPRKELVSTRFFLLLSVRVLEISGHGRACVAAALERRQGVGGVRFRARVLNGSNRPRRAPASAHNRTLCRRAGATARLYDSVLPKVSTSVQSFNCTSFGVSYTLTTPSKSDPAGKNISDHLHNHGASVSQT